MSDGTMMKLNNDLGEAIQTGLVDPIRKSFKRQQESLAALDKRLRILTVIAVVNLLITAALLGVIITKLL